MNFFSEKKTPAQNLAFMGMMAAINAVLGVFATFVPLSAFFIILFLPLASALVGEFCEDKYLLPYVLAASLVAAAATAYDMGTALFYIIPAIVSGTFYGFMAKRRPPVSLLIFSTALVELALNYLSLPLVATIYQIDMIQLGETILGLSGNLYINDIVPAFIFGFGLAEASLSHFFIRLFFQKTDLPFSENGFFDLACPLTGILFSGLAVGFAFMVMPIAYLFLSFAIFFAVFSAMNLLRKNPWWLYVLMGLLSLGSLYGMAASYALMPRDGGLLLISLFLLSIDTPSLISTLLLLRAQKAPKK
jgi:hypothetical protein